MTDEDSLAMWFQALAVDMCDQDATPKSRARAERRMLQAILQLAKRDPRAVAALTAGRPAKVEIDAGGVLIDCMITRPQVA
jgi:hypothetical protein